MGQRLVRDKTKNGQLSSTTSVKNKNIKVIEEKLLDDSRLNNSNFSGNTGSVVITIRMLKMEPKCHKCNGSGDDNCDCRCYQIQQPSSTQQTVNYNDFIRNRLLNNTNNLNSNNNNNNNLMMITNSFEGQTAAATTSSSSSSSSSSTCDNYKNMLKNNNNNNDNNNQMNIEFEQLYNHIPDININNINNLNNINNNQLGNNLNKNQENNISKLCKLNIIEDDIDNNVTTSSSSSSSIMYNNIELLEDNNAVIPNNNNNYSNVNVLNINNNNNISEMTSDCINITNNEIMLGSDNSNVTADIMLRDETVKCDNNIEVSSQNNETCNNCKRKTLTSLGTSKRLRGCKLCRSSNCNKESQTAANLVTSASGSTSKDNSSNKSKKGNWSLKLNCAKLKGGKNSSSSSASSSANSSNCSINVNIGEKNDPCVCTSFRKNPEDQDSPTDNNLEQSILLSSSSSSSTSSSDSSSATSTANQVEQLFPATTTASLLSNNNNNTTSDSVTTPPSIHFQQQPQPPLLNSNGQIIQRTATAFYSSLSNGTGGGNLIVLSMNQTQPLLDFTRYNSEDYPIEDCDERARIQRAVEIAEGVEPPPGFQPRNPPIITTPNSPHWHMLCTPDTALHNFLQGGFVLQNNCILHSEQIPRIHSQVDYIHCLVPDLQKITSCGFYWGKMDRYEAERLLEGKPEGTFLLRDSAQEEYLFSVSFRKYGRSLHARIEQFNHKFSFDSHDPGVYTASTVTGLLEHYKDPTCVMFFEPMLTIPLNRNFTFSLQQLCRATIVSNTTYDKVNEFSLPKALKSYLREYHYRQRVRVKRFDEHTYVNS